MSKADDSTTRKIFVRMEIATALNRDILVIPVLVDGVAMPAPTDLPDDLKPLVRRNALLVSDMGFDDDCRRLVAAIKQAQAEALKMAVLQVCSRGENLRR